MRRIAGTGICGGSEPCSPLSLLLPPLPLPLYPLAVMWPVVAVDADMRACGGRRPDGSRTTSLPKSTDDPGVGGAGPSDDRGCIEKRASRGEVGKGIGRSVSTGSGMSDDRCWLL